MRGESGSLIQGPIFWIAGKRGVTVDNLTKLPTLEGEPEGNQRSNGELHAMSGRRDSGPLNLRRTNRQKPATNGVGRGVVFLVAGREKHYSYGQFRTLATRRKLRQNRPFRRGI